MRREDDGAAGVPSFLHEVKHLGAGGWVEIRRGLIEDDQRAVDGQHHCQGKFLSHPGAHPGNLSSTVEVESVRNAGGPRAAALGAEVGKKIEHL